MEFLNRMKKREYIEMGLKTAIGVLLGIIIIFLMEAMISGIYMDAIDKVKTFYSTTGDSVYYVVDNKDSTYDVYINYKSSDGADTWARKYDNLSSDDYHEKMINATGEFHGNSTNYIVYTKNYFSNTEKTALELVVNDYENSHSNLAFTVYTKADASSDFTVYSNNIDYTSLVELFGNSGALNDIESSLYFVCVNNTFKSNSDRSAIDSFKSTFKNKHNNETFTIYSDENAALYEDVSYYKVVELFSAKGEFKNAKDLIFRKPNCFEIYINGIHYAVMIVFILIIGGVYAWRFTLISKEYKKLERKFKKTGKVFI